MSNWKFTDATNKVVNRFNEDGSQESCLVEVLADWLSEGNTPEPADVPPPPSTLEQIRALEAQYADAQAKITRQLALKALLDEAMTYPEANGLTRGQVHGFLLANAESAYTKLWNLEQQVEALRAQV